MEHNNIRAGNAELLVQYGVNQWRAYNIGLEDSKVVHQSRLAMERAKVCVPFLLFRTDGHSNHWAGGLRGCASKIACRCRAEERVRDSPRLSWNRKCRALIVLDG